MNPTDKRADHPAGSRRAAGRGPRLAADRAASASVLLVTGDGAVRAQVRRCADRAGADLAEYPDLASAQRHGVGAAVVLIGADLLDVALLGADRSGTALQTVAGAWPATAGRRGQLLVLVARRADVELFVTAAALHASYVTLAPTELAWLTDQLRPAAAGAVDRRRQTDGRGGGQRS
ncbi:hypothetical protein AB0M46_05565 [Dactylosporangium sp. NPDC051485]|uniref:hypothetical protein n=1 Tax=Dactylosporangium sp. NPDC051485 TaxID=3154846 RepID=UPI00341718FE